MKKLILFSLLFCCAWPLCAQEEDELIIEMTGTSQTDQPQAPSLWDFNARQLTRKLRGQTREQILYAMPVVSDRDGILQGTAQEYALVEYDKAGAFRKFLFRAETPQTLLAVAATPADVLAVNKKYAVNIGLSQKDFEDFYGEKAILQQTPSLPETMALYRLPYQDINTPQKQTHWFLFENGQLSQTFSDQAQKDTFLQSYTQATEQAAAQAAQQNSVSAQSSTSQKPLPKRRPARPRKALLYGGTTWDQMYMPRVTNPHPALLPPAAKTESK